MKRALATKPPATTAEEDRHSAGQRRVNMTWEYTQTFIAVIVVMVTVVVDAVVSLYGQEKLEIRTSALMQLNVMAGLVIGFYFGRTNHQRVGGVDLGR